MSICNCSELARVAAAVDREELKGLARLSEHPAIIIVTYLTVILPWTILYNFDFISEKWRSIHHTRRLGQLHLVIALFPMPLLGFYTHLQQISKDYKEMMTAVIGLLLCLYHVMRTSWGLLQLRVFSKWCGSLIRRMKALGMIQSRHWRDIADEKVVNWDSLDRRREKILSVNNTVVDNELSGTDLGVSIDKNKVSCKTNPSEWLKTDEHVLTAIRWSGAFLCSFGEFWGGFNKIGFAHKEEVEKVFADFRGSLNALHRVTFMKEGKRCSFSAVEWKNKGPYETAVVEDDLPKMIKALEPRKILLENVMGSYTGVNALNKYRHPENGVVCALLYAQCLDDASFDALVKYSNDFPGSTPLGWELLVWQNREFESPVPLVSAVPTFPWGTLMVPLFDSCTNWRVLQASAHMDNIVVPQPGRDMRVSRRPPGCFFEHTRERQQQQNLGRSKSFKPGTYGYTGCVLEMVRSFLADWIVTSAPESPDWSPPLPQETSDFPIIRYIEITGEPCVKREKLMQWRWEFQSILQNRVAKMDRRDANFPATLDLILLFILAFPGTFVEDNGSDRNPSQTRAVSAEGNQGSAAGPSQSPGHEIVNMPDEGEVDLVFLFQTKIAPQNIKVRIWVHGNENAEEREVVMKLICDKSGTSFNWENWINCAMGYIRSRDEYMSDHPKFFSESIRNFRERTPAKANLSKGMRTITSDLLEVEKIPGELQVWEGWPFFDIKLVQFEINQWMQKAGYLHGFCDVVALKTKKELDKFTTELRRAEEGLLKITKFLAPDNSG